MTHDKKVGGWLNDENEKFYYDSIKIFTNLAKENRQLAIFDLTNLKLIKL